MATDTLTHYKSILGVRSDADMDAVNTSYFLLVDKLTANPTEDDARRLQEIQHAYSVLRRACGKKAESAAAATAAAEPKRGLRSVAVTVAVLLGLIALLVAMNASRLRVAMITHGPGEVLRITGHTETYGTIVGFSDAHQFAAGKPTPAYQIRLAAGGGTIWVGERTVDLTMTGR